MSLANKPKTITMSNLNNFFDIKPSNVGAAKPGMFLWFDYKSPEGVHDKKPLVFVLEKRADRIWGLNFHYNFGLMVPIIQLKEQQIQEFLEKTPEYKKYYNQQKEAPVEDLEGEIPNVIDVKEQQKEKDQKLQFDIKKIRFPADLLEDYSNDAIKPPLVILRNYLFPRMRSVYKLSYKVV
jgi:hypothetical protein